MAYVRNFPKRFSVKFETRSGEPCGNAFSTGRTTTSRTAAARKAQRSRVRIASLGREETGRAPLDEQDHEHEYGDLAKHGAEADRGQVGAERLAYPAGHHDHERVHDIVLAELGPDVADLGEGASGQPR